MAGLDALGRLNAAEVPSDHHEGIRGRGKRPEVALIAVIRTLAARGGISLRQDPRWQDALAETFRIPQKSHLTTNTDAHVDDGGRPTRSDIGHSLRPDERTMTSAAPVAFARGGGIRLPAEAA